MVFGNRHYIFCACFFEKFSPLIRIEFFSFELRYEIFVPKLVLGSVCGNMMFVNVCSFYVHFAGIPFVSIGGHGVDAPMNEYAKLRIPVPIGYGIVTERG